MSNNKLYKLSICITDLANLPDQAVKKASNGKFYLNCTLWINEKENQYGAIGTLQVDIPIENGGGYETKYIGSVRNVISQTPGDETKSWKQHISK